MPKFAANLTMLFNELPFLDRFAAAKAARFTGVEYLFPYDFEKAVLGEQLQQHGLTQVLHNLPAENWAAGERGIAILPDRTSEFRDGVKRAIEYAKALGCRQVNCLAGIAPAGAGPAELHAVFVENLRYAAAALSKQAIQIISEVGSENLFVQYDIYHMQIMEGDLAPTMKKHLDHIAHIELADNPGGTSRVPAKSTTPSCFAISTRSDIVARSAVNTSRRPPPWKVLGGTSRIRSMRNQEEPGRSE